MSPTAAARSPVATSSLRDRLKDPALLREACFIDGGWIGTPATVVTNPATHQEIGRVPDMNADDATRAVEAAQRAFPAWSKLTAKQRSNILRKWFELIVAHREDLALILTTEQGKPLAEALGEVDIGGAYVEFYAEEARRIYGETIPTQRPDARLIAIRQPIGVCAAITPWNFPSSMITRKVSPALAAGCTVVLKPANETPFSALGAGGAGGARRDSQGRIQRRHRRCAADRQSVLRTSVGALRRLHRLHRGRQDSVSAGGGGGEEARARTRRQRAVHRVRRRRHRRRGRRCDGVEISQRRPDLRLRQSHLCPGQGLRRLRAKARGKSRGAQGRRRHRAGRDPRPADHRGSGGEDRTPHRRCAARAAPAS